jgi:hypothetical protein
MLVADDEGLALILRFTALDRKGDEADERFLREQVQAMQRYLADFPPEEQGQRAMEWVQARAREYRRNWQNREADRRSFAVRCQDCPLRRRGAERHCEVHEQWLFLLRRYISGEIRTRKYVKRTLRLLKAHKKQLRHQMAADYADWVDDAKLRRLFRPG